MNLILPIEVTLKGFRSHDGTELEDLQNLSFRYIKTFANDVDLALTIDNILDEEVEVLPGYNNRGRQIMLTVQRKW